MVDLVWGNPHSLRLYDDTVLKRTRGILHLVKGGGRQDIPIIFPEGMTQPMIVAAWEDQGRKWVDLFEHKGPPFVATRVIWLPDGQCLMWNLFHVNDAPHDTCGVALLDKVTWPNTKITAVTAV